MKQGGSNFKAGLLFMEGNLRKWITSASHRLKSRGSITVEAAFVMPIVLLTVFAILYLSFYLHDMCRIQGSVDMVLHNAGLSTQGSTQGSTLDAEEEQMKLYLRQQLSQGLFLSKVTGITVKAGSFSLEVSVEADSSVTIPMLQDLFKQISHRTMEGEYLIHNPAETLRQCEIILDTASDIKGVKELKKIVENFLESGKNNSGNE